MAQKTIWRLYHTRASQAEQEARGSAACVRACAARVGGVVQARAPLIGCLGG